MKLILGNAPVSKYDFRKTYLSHGYATARRRRTSVFCVRMLSGKVRRPEPCKSTFPCFSDKAMAASFVVRMAADGDEQPCVLGMDAFWQLDAIRGGTQKDLSPKVPYSSQRSVHLPSIARSRRLSSGVDSSCTTRERTTRSEASVWDPERLLYSTVSRTASFHARRSHGTALRAIDGRSRRLRQ